MDFFGKRSGFAYVSLVVGFLVVVFSAFAGHFTFGAYSEWRGVEEGLFGREERPFLASIFATSAGVLSGVTSLVRETFVGDGELAGSVVLRGSREVFDDSGGGGGVFAAREPCVFDVSDSFSRRDVVISEIAWAGGLGNFRDEWMELENISTYEVDMSGFWLLDRGGDIEIDFPSGSKIGPSGFFLLERGDDDSVYDVVADLVYKGSLSNEGEDLMLFDADCDLIDEVLAGDGWFAGDNESKKTMERGSDFSWHASAVSEGTPREDNSVISEQTNGELGRRMDVEEPQVADPKFVTGSEEEQSVLEEEEDELALGSSTSTEVKVFDGDSIEEVKPNVEVVLPECSFETVFTPTRQGVIINEVAWMGTVQFSSDEWIELKNISTYEVDISGWWLLDKAEQIRVNFGDSVSVPAGGFYLLERGSDSSSPAPADMIYVGALSNRDEGLRLFDSECSLVDEVVTLGLWPGGDNYSKWTMERDDSFGWQTSADEGGTPRAENSSVVPVPSGGGVISTEDPGGDGDSPGVSFLINEIMYDLLGADAGREWVEVLNVGSAFVDIANWRFFEGGVNHGLSLVQGTSEIPAQGYAIIADDTSKFLDDYPGYSGALFDSSFSLSNSGESVALKNGDEVVDEVSYSSEWGGGGDGNSLQFIGGGWQAALPTPSSENELSVEAPVVDPVATSTSVVLLSEFQVGSGSAVKYEFVELYNTGESPVDLSGWDLKKRTSSGNLYNLATNIVGVVQPGGFFLVASGEYDGAVEPDFRYTQSSNYLASSNNAVVLIDGDGNVVDEIFYDSVLVDQSFERKALQDGVCVSAQGGGELLGNGCDTDQSSDFEVRVSPNPQSSLGAAEP